MKYITQIKGEDLVIELFGELDIQFNENSDYYFNGKKIFFEDTNFVLNIECPNEILEERNKEKDNLIITLNKNEIKELVETGKTKNLVIYEDTATFEVLNEDLHIKLEYFLVDYIRDANFILEY